MHVLAGHAYAAARGRELAADQLEQRRLARAAAAQDRHHLALGDDERQAAEDLEVAVGEAQSLDPYVIMSVVAPHASTIPPWPMLTPRSPRKSCSTRARRRARTRRA